MNSEQELSLINSESDTSLYKHKLTLDKIRNELINFGLLVCENCLENEEHLDSEDEIESTDGLLRGKIHE